MEIPIKMDDLGVTLFLETPICCIQFYFCVITTVECHVLLVPIMKNASFKRSSTHFLGGPQDMWIHMVWVNLLS